MSESELHLPHAQGIFNGNVYGKISDDFMRYITRILFLALCTDALYLLNQYNYRFFTEAIN